MNRRSPAAALLLPLLLLAACGGKGNPAGTAPPSVPAAASAPAPVPANAAAAGKGAVEPFTAVPPPIAGGDPSAPRVTALRLVPDPSRPSAGMGVEVQGVSPRGKAFGYDVSWSRNGEDAGTGPFLAAGARRGDRIRVTVRPYDTDGYGTPAWLDREVRNAPPVVGSPVEAAFEGGLWSARVPAADGDADVLSFRLKEGPPGMTVDGEGRVKWPVPAGFAGTVSATVVVADGSGGESEGTFRLTIPKD